MAKSTSISAWLPVVGLAWLVPGGGHFMLQRKGRAMLLGGAVLLSFIAGLVARGAFFSPEFGDLFTTLIYTGGFIGDAGSGILYLLAVWFGYDQPDLAGHSFDYGTKFLVAAGLMNILTMVDAYEIATGKKS